jgi:outer membrane protein assembly factor BamE (lipoprotein component of BamABCDE complex)
MTQGTIWTALVAAALVAAPLRAQDSIAPVKHDTAAAAAAAPAQPSSGELKPGMTEADVRGLWGNPVAVRRANDWTYLFFRNGRERQVGFYDVVFLQGGQVVDAIVRGSDHTYAGQSSSPEGRKAEFTPPDRPAADTSSGAVTGVRVKPGR